MLLRVHPDIAIALENQESEMVEDIQNSLKLNLEIRADDKLSIDQFEIES